MEREEEGRKRRRPPSAEAHKALLRVALLVFVEDDLAGMRLEQVAARASVSKVTLYRHWSSKRAVVIDAPKRLGEDVPIHETGDLHADLPALLRGLAPGEMPHTPPVVEGSVGRRPTAPPLRARSHQFGAQERVGG